MTTVYYGTPRHTSLWKQMKDAFMTEWNRNLEEKQLPPFKEFLVESFLAVVPSRVDVFFEPRDLWVGLYWNKEDGYFMHEGDVQIPVSLLQVYICFIPMFPILIEWDDSEWIEHVLHHHGEQQSAVELEEQMFRKAAIE